MNCPTCNKPEMERGCVYLHKSILNWLFLGLGSSELYFRNGKMKNLTLWSGGEKEALKCYHCDTVIIQPTVR